MSSNKGIDKKWSSTGSWQQEKECLRESSAYCVMNCFGREYLDHIGLNKSVSVFGDDFYQTACSSKRLGNDRLQMHWT